MKSPRTRGKSSWLNSKLGIGTSKIHGNGVFAGARLAMGERVAIFGGDVMAIDEINELPDRLQEYPMQIEERFVLGRRASAEPEPADFFNHSCEPNCGFKGQIFLVAMRSVRRGEEITFDYGMVVSESVDSDIVFEMPCHCRTKSCRQVITESDWKLKALQRKYRGFFSQYLQERIDALRRGGR
ncbi:MAG TPA: SET domain-containing protein-lysine N-methyltransferase [Bryobacteraceae bacterium]|nr:SET domain-containing protein-lysine N-methyltransferase [Bryobacteraceae bacterium]